MKNRRRSTFMGIIAVVGLTLVSVGVTSGAASAATIGNVIKCTITFNDPHDSGHVGGTVNATVTTVCGQSVDVIRSFITLKDLTHKRTSTSPGGSTTFGKRTNEGNAAMSCKPGIYQATGEVDVTFGPDYTPVAASAEGASKAMNAPCSNATRVASDSGNAEEPSIDGQSFTIEIPRPVALSN
jgi:hypothetical protein